MASTGAYGRRRGAIVVLSAEASLPRLEKSNYLDLTPVKDGADLAGATMRCV
jgi:hypothetical protein